jgi:general secretion pathway protein N
MTGVSRPLFIALLVFVGLLALLLLMPLGVAASAMGVSARHSQGSIMSGALRDATFGRVRIGDVNAKLRFLPLFSGKLSFAVQRGDAPHLPGVSGAIGSGFRGPFAHQFTATIDGGSVIKGLERSEVRLEGVSFAFSNGRCASASGVVRLSLDNTPLGSAIKGDLMGNASCSNGDLLLPLLSASTMESTSIRIKGDGRYEIIVMVSEPSADKSVVLGFAGFQPVSGGLRLARSGKLD